MMDESDRKITAPISIRHLGVALVALALASLLTLMIPSLNDGGMYFLFLTAIICSTLQGSIRTGILATVLSLALNLVLLDYLDKFPESIADWAIFLAFGVAAVFTLFLLYQSKSAEEGRIEAERKYRVIFEDSITGIYETTLDGNYLTANPKLAEMLGYGSAEELLRTSGNLKDKFYAENGRREEFVRLVEQNDSLTGFESLVVRRDGQNIWVSENAVSVRNRDGDLTGFQGTTIEITAQKKAEFELLEIKNSLESKVRQRTEDLELSNLALTQEMEERHRVEVALRLSEEKFRTLVETSTDLIWETNEKGVYTYVSPKIKDLVGYEPDEVIGKRPYDLMTPEESKRVKDSVRQIGQSRIGQKLFESEQVHKNGETVTTETSSIPVYDNEGKLLGARGIARDVTERKRIESELLASRSQLRDLTAHLQAVREEERKNIARELHDELGQSLTAVKIELSRISEAILNSKGTSTKSSDQITPIIDLVDTALETTRKIVSDLRPGILDELGLAAAFEWQAQEFQRLTSIQCDLEIDLEEDRLTQKTRIALFRILQECFTNITRHAEAERVEVRLNDNQNKLTLQVEDDGRGIRDEEARNPRSFGLLGMSERAVLLGGVISIRRRNGSGTIVHVEIPVPEERGKAND